MRIFKFSKQNLLRRDITYVAKPLAMVLFVLFLFFIVVKMGYSQVSSQLSELESARKTERVLEEKVSILRQIESGILEKTDTSVIALPQVNPAPLVTSLLRTFSENQSLLLDKIEIRGGTKVKGSDMASIELLVKASSVEEALSIIELVRSFASSIPMSTIDAVSIRKNRDGFTFSLIIYYYWSDFPTEIPAITEPIVDITQKETELLSKISNYTKPSFSVLEPSSPRERENLFE